MPSGSAAAVGLDYHVEIARHLLQRSLHPGAPGGRGPGDETPPSRFSCAASASPRTCARPASTGPPPCRTTCRARTGVIATGPTIRSGARPPGSGADAATLIDVILTARPHPEQGFRSAIGIIGLAKRHGPERVDAACARAIALGARSYNSVAAILKNRTDSTHARRRGAGPAPRQHPRPRLLPLRRDAC